jgi:hypothetical protein
MDGSLRGARRIARARAEVACAAQIFVVADVRESRACLAASTPQRGRVPRRARGAMHGLGREDHLWQARCALRRAVSP